MVPLMRERESSSRRGYGSRWQKARETFLRSHPLCVMCMALGRVVPATVVDHRIPHRGDQALFWDTNNWQSLCKDCHDSAKAREERSGIVPGCDLSGIPLAPNHPWRGGVKN